MDMHKQPGRPRKPENYYLDNDELFDEIHRAKKNGFASERLG